MANTNAILQKLRNRARTTGFSYQLILQLFCQEEFLRRLATSKYRDKFILKGGLLIFAYANFQNRPTMDIDFLIRNIVDEKNIIVKVINEIINEETENDFIEFQIKMITDKNECKEQHWKRIKMIGLISNTITPFNIDIEVGEVIVLKPELKKLSVQLEGFHKPEILMYSLELIIAEKWDAIISRMEGSSRMKDYFDIYYLANHYNFEGRKLQEVIYNTLQKSETTYHKDTIKNVEDLYNDEMIKRWKAFCKNSLELDIGFKDVIKDIIKFIGVPFTAIINEEKCNKNWNSNSHNYE